MSEHFGRLKVPGFTVKCGPHNLEVCEECGLEEQVDLIGTSGTCVPIIAVMGQGKEIARFPAGTHPNEIMRTLAEMISDLKLENQAFRDGQKPLFGNARSRILKALKVTNVDEALEKILELVERVAQLEDGIRSHKKLFCDEPLQEERDLWALVGEEVE